MKRGEIKQDWMPLLYRAQSIIPLNDWWEAERERKMSKNKQGILKY